MYNNRKSLVKSVSLLLICTLSSFCYFPTKLSFSEGEFVLIEGGSGGGGGGRGNLKIDLNTVLTRL